MGSWVARRGGRATRTWVLRLGWRRVGAARRSDEQPLAVRQDEVPADGGVRGVLGLVTFDHQLHTDLEALLRHALTDQRVRTAAFDHPLDDFAARALHFDVKPGVRVDHLPLDE